MCIYYPKFECAVCAEKASILISNERYLENSKVLVVGMQKPKLVFIFSWLATHVSSKVKGNIFCKTSLASMRLE